jgi:hypothetical protein
MVDAPDYKSSHNQPTMRDEPYSQQVVRAVSKEANHKNSNGPLVTAGHAFKRLSAD